MNITTNVRLFGGAKPSGMPIYCGSNPTVPKGKVRGRPNQCFYAGRSAGFYAGVLKGQQQVPLNTSQPPVQPISRKTLIQATEASVLAQQKRQRMKTEAQWRALNQRAMQSQAKEWNMRNYGRAKTDLVDDFIAEARRKGLVI